MSIPSRAVRILLQDWQAAGLTHLPHAIPGEPVEFPETASAPVQESSSLAETAPVESVSPVYEPMSSGSARSDSGSVAEAPQAGIAPDHSSSDDDSPPFVPPGEMDSPPESEDALKKGRRPQGRAARQTTLDVIAGCVKDCRRCPELAEARTNTVFGVGDPTARVMFIGEAPGADEDASGEPFVGRAGQLLNRIITACGWTREELYICNILRCRPPGNRAPLPQEAANCREYLDGQIRIVDPDYIICWGTSASQYLLGVTDPIGKLRGQWFQHGKARVLCTYHPSYLLRNPAAKKPVWEDMLILLGEMGITPPSLQSGS